MARTQSVFPLFLRIPNSYRHIEYYKGNVICIWDLRFFKLHSITSVKPDRLGDPVCYQLSHNDCFLKVKRFSEQQRQKTALLKNCGYLSKKNKFKAEKKEKPQVGKIRPTQGMAHNNNSIGTANSPLDSNVIRTCSSDTEIHPTNLQLQIV